MGASDRRTGERRADLVKQPEAAVCMIKIVEFRDNHTIG